MNDIKTFILSVIGALLTLLAPIKNLMIAMLILLGLNFIFGLISDIVKGRGWDTKKALYFFWYSAIFFIVACAIFIIGYLMDEKEQATTAVKIICLVAVYIFGTNIFRNWLSILVPGTQWYKFVSLVYYVLSVKFIERFKFAKEWKKVTRESEEAANNLNDKKDEPK